MSKSKSVKDPTLYDVIIKPLITEKATIILEQNKYVFQVRTDATKKRVKFAIESIFNVDVTKVNIVCINGKKKRGKGGVIGKRSDYKKALVTLKDGQSIDTSAGA